MPIERLILLSPGLNYQGLKPDDAIMTFKGEVLVASAEMNLVQLARNGFAQSRSLYIDDIDGDAHGTDIIQRYTGRHASFDRLDLKN